jgi:hypothetical protein
LKLSAANPQPKKGEIAIIYRDLLRTDSQMTTDGKPAKVKEETETGSFSMLRGTIYVAETLY